MKPSSLCHSVGRQLGGSGSLIAMFPASPGFASLPSSSRMRRSYPGIGKVGDPGLVGFGSRPIGSAAIAQPVSVCHQWSMTGTFSRSPAQR